MNKNRGAVETALKKITVTYNVRLRAMRNTREKI